MSEKVMLDFPGFITRDSQTRHILCGDESVVLAANTIIAEQYRQLFDSLGYEKTADVIYNSVEKGAYEVQRSLLKTYRVHLKDEADLDRHIARLPGYIQTYGYGRGKTVKEGPEFVFQVFDSFLADSLRDCGLPKGVCFMLAGFFAGMARAYAELLDKSYSFTCTETKCRALGDPYCEFKLSRNPAPR